MKKIYFAGAWFSPEQEEQHTRIYELLNGTNKFDIFNPKLESLITPESDQDALTQTLNGNIAGVIYADIIVALVDKPYDSGTVFECGLAYGRTPIIYYVERLNGKPFNLMLAKTGRVATNGSELLALLDDESSYEIQSVYDFEGVVE